MKTQTDNLNGFRTHGVEFSRFAENQAVGDCPFCDKEGHFYANRETRLWDCKRCGAKGNFEDFLGGVAENYKENLSDERLFDLARNRGLPSTAFRGWPVGFNGDRYSLPIQNSKGRVVDLRMFRLGGKLLSTPTASSGLFNAKELALPSNIGNRVWLCEGEWDAIAWHWLLRSCGIQDPVVGVPGANTFKGAWIPLFDGRHVSILYDNDIAGQNGDLTVQEKLAGTASKLDFLHWPEGYGEGYDIRDHVKDIAVKKKDKRGAYEAVVGMLKGTPRALKRNDPANPLLPEEPAVNLGKEEGGEKKELAPISVDELVGVYRKWLHMASIDSLKIMYGCILANKLDGDPIWLFLVAPPGGSKSELLMSLAKGKGAHALSSLTPHTLISGASWKEGQDPSLLPKLNHKMLIIKDFTTLLTMNYVVRDEIFGTLRDVYDGNTEKQFGNGITRKYAVRFGVLAGVTPAIETFNVVHQGLGERFLKFRISGNWDQITEEDKILRALNNIGQEDKMRLELQEAGSRWLAHAKIPETGIPPLSDDLKMRFVHLAKFSARLRGVVERDKFNGQVLYKPSSEVGTRIAKQLAKLSQGVCMFLGKTAVDEEAYKLVRRVALDTVPDRSEDIVRAMWGVECDAAGATCLTGELVNRTRLPQTTVFRVLQDLNLLKIVENRNGGKGQANWCLADNIKEHIRLAYIFEGKKKVKMVLRRD